MKAILGHAGAFAFGLTFACGIKYVFAAFLIAFLLLGNQ
jgi:hypothetical protein